jgi:hypothetical protein
MPPWGRQRAGSGQSDSESTSESDSDVRQRPQAGLGIRRAPPRPPIIRAPARLAVNPQVQCPGCGRVFASLHILKKHKNSHRLANAACRAASRAMKRPRSVPRAAGEAPDSDGDGPAGDAEEQISRMMGDGCQSVAPGDAPDPSRYPGHWDGVSGHNFCVEKVSMCTEKQCVH